MPGRIKRSLQRFGASRPGHRFKDRYRRHQESEGGWLDPRRLFYVVGGLTLALGSLAFGVLPGPGFLTFFLGLAMVAGEFRPVAHVLDWAEVKARELFRWARRVWKTSEAGRVLLALAGLLLAAAVAYLASLLLGFG